MNFKISGKPTFEDYLKMVHRLSNRATFIASIGGLIIGKVVFTLFKWSELLLLILAVLYVLLVLINYYVVIPYRAKIKYKKNTSISQKRCFSFYDKMKFEFPIYKVVYYDDAVYIISENNQAMMIKREWLPSNKLWDDFTQFIAEQIVPQITPRFYRR